MTAAGVGAAPVAYVDRRVLRELLLVSGNTCAFPGCGRPLIDADGAYVGRAQVIGPAQVVAVAADERPGEPERLAAADIVLFCRTDHGTEGLEPAPLADLKGRHEAAYRSGIEAFVASFRAPTGSGVEPPMTLHSWQTYFGYADTLPPREHHRELTAFMRLATRLERLPEAARRVLAVLVKRGGGKDHLTVAFGPLAEAAHLALEELSGLLGQLDAAGFVHLSTAGEVETRDLEMLRWDYIRDYCSGSGIDLADLVVSLRFDLLD